MPGARGCGRLAVVWAVACAALLSGCAGTHYPINAPLAQVDPQAGYRPQVLFEQTPDDQFVLVVAFSGGGARAAALGFGVLEALRDTTIQWQGQTQRLIDQIDIVSGVSGGSILATAFALKGPAGLPEFEEKFLRGTLQSDLVLSAMSPRNLWRLSSPRFGRSDLLQELLDDKLYGGATFADLLHAGRKPFLSVYASDLGSGGRFEFTQDVFDFLCSDLAPMPLARAVAASSAAPLVLSPVTLWNHAPPSGQPGCGEPAVQQQARQQARLEAGVDAVGVAAPNASVTALFAGLNSYRDATTAGPARPFVHLLDGGLSDNIGARGPLDFSVRFGGVVSGTRSSGFRKVQRSVLIFVNAETSARSAEDSSADVPGLLRAALALADIPINRNSSTALDQMRTTLASWRAEVAAAHARGEFDTYAQGAQLHLIEVSLAAEPDAQLREGLLAIPTNLQLPWADVQRLRQYGAAALRAQPEFQALLRALTPAAPSP